MRKPLLLLVFLALSCGGSKSDPASPQCQNFFGSGTTHVDVTISGSVSNGANSCPVSQTWFNIPITQNACTFTSGATSPAIAGTFAADGSVLVTVSGSALSGCPAGVAGHGTISGATISGTLDSIGDCDRTCTFTGKAHVSFSIHKL